MSRFSANCPVSECEVDFDNSIGEHAFVVLGVHKTAVELISRNWDESMGSLELFKSSFGCFIGARPVLNGVWKV